MAQNEVVVNLKGKETVSAATKKAGGSLKNFGQSARKAGMAMSVMGAAITASLGVAINKFATAGDEVQKMSLRTSWAVESLSELRHVAEITGTELAAFEKGSRRMAASISDANDGLETYVRDFDKLGLKAGELIKLKPEEAFWKIAEALGAMENEIEQANIAQGIFGRTGTALLPMLAEGADGIQRLREEAHTLGLVFDQEAADKAAKFKDDLTRLKGAVTGLSMEIAGPLMDSLDPFLQNLKEVSTEAVAWMNVNPTIAKQIGIIALGLGGVLVVMGPILVMLPGIIAGFGLLAAAFSPVTIAILALVFAGTYLLTNWEDIKKGYKNLWQVLTGKHGGFVMEVSAETKLLEKERKAEVDALNRARLSTDELTATIATAGQAIQSTTSNIGTSLEQINTDYGTALSMVATGAESSGKVLEHTIMNLDQAFIGLNGQIVRVGDELSQFTHKDIVEGRLPEKGLAGIPEGMEVWRLPGGELTLKPKAEPKPIAVNIGVPPEVEDMMGFAKGGIVPGRRGMPRLAVVHGGEAITPNPGLGNIVINVAGSLLTEGNFLELVREEFLRLKERTTSTGF